ncbi:MAG TPA: AI-2E family transporter [Candidatus Limnocylindrales bacterium]|jgi:predicted PurR-regulated permease PerM
MTRTLSGRDRRWLGALLVLGTVTVALILIDQVAGYLTYFSDIILIFFLAWLLAFILAPVPDAAHRWAPRLPRLVVVAVVYLVLVFGLLVLTVVTAQLLASSITAFIESVPDFIEQLPELLAPWQGFLDQFGLRIDLEAAAQAILAGVGDVGGSIVQPLTDVALASIGVVGNLVLVLVLSVYIVIDRDRMLDFMQRLVPARYVDDARFLRVSVAKSFGGFLRGQAILGIVYFVVALGCQLVLGLDYTIASAVLAGALMAIPFFGPFVAWMPPVIVAALTAPELIVPALLIMVIGVLAELNIVQPRVMAGAVGISPLVVLGSVIVGAKLAGIAGAVFAVPIAAVASSVFLFYLDRYRPLGPSAADLHTTAVGEPLSTEPPPSMAAGVQAVAAGEPLAGDPSAHYEPHAATIRTVVAADVAGESARPPVGTVPDDAAAPEAGS